MGWSGTPTTIVFAVVDGDEHPGWALLWQTAAAMAGVISPSSASASDDADGADDDVRPAAVDHHGILAGGSAVCARP